MQQRIDRLRAEISRLHHLARGCDRDLARQMHALAAEMEQTAQEMQERLDAAPADNKPVAMPRSLEDGPHHESNFPDVDVDDRLRDQRNPLPPIPGEGRGAKLPE